MADKMPISLFVSDIHLSESRNDLVTAFTTFIDKIASKADNLYILGDLFDFWAGDDIQTPLTLKVSAYLHKIQQQGVKIYFVPGNRDFALGKKYAQAAGMVLAGEEVLIDDHILLIHGDELCIDDKEYQRYKKWIRHPIILTILKHLPKIFRLRLANKIREKSKSVGKKRITDVTESFVETFFEKKNIDTIIHGHTHRADKHQYPQGYYRYVLSDWDEYGDYLKLENGKISRHSFSIEEMNSGNVE